VGAGIAGLSCARALKSQGARVSVFERDALPGGRLGTSGDQSVDFDAGAQFLTPQSAGFARELRGWVDANVVRSWDARLVRLVGGAIEDLPQGALRLVGMPDMRAIADHLVHDLELTCGAEVAHLVRTPGGWLLFDSANTPLGSEPFDTVVLAVPSVIGFALARDASDLALRLAGTSWNACWVASMLLARRSGIDFDGAFIDDDPILAWAVRESSKPGRRLPDGSAERWVLQARTSWSNSFARLPAAEAGRWMQRAFAARLAIPLAQKSCVATLWQLSTPAASLPEKFLWDAAERIGFAGDWLGAPHIEGAWQSGQELARAIGAGRA
jgi:predicted NAD/FAD-dependent oxidoreductase